MTSIPEVDIYERRQTYYGWMVIKSFADKTTAALFCGHRARKLPPEIQRRAQIQLTALDAADTLEFLRAPPTNELTPLHCDPNGQWTFRINDRWRISFRWDDRDAYDVEVSDGQ